ncbi:vitellogenin-1-like isoform X1 [Metopolophium dirhodum]|uniref:vitellogenin-1-like isoform X1 n=1 Tax=Metopolophium dirhodum TaxID=44670 RepID=UPI00298F8D68|nr:vitellogenin-1-like isoform X1 [Metopolophium dirhodum]XP_060858850.1 vitellogenin-1-like isoform X1 [Metopolophium dirhodum]XP_060858851.1 vitellogenin-1-like isoform X1 [Metopolophium dirhodum]XP_060858852.1 vitellogenin-1-like isoform X1 [Metopolophium dirhodum]
MSKYSSDSNSRDRTRSYSRYYNQRHRSSSSSSTDSSRYSRKNHSSRSGSRHHKKSTRRHRSNSSSEYSSSRHKHSSRSYRKDESRSKRKHHRKSSSTSYDSNNSNSSIKNHQSKSSKAFNDNERNKRVQPNSFSTFQDDSLVVKSETVSKKDHDANWIQNNVLDIVKRENSIEQINQEGFVFKVFNPSSEPKYVETTDQTKYDVPNINEEVIDNLPTDESTFFICNKDRLLNARYKLLTKQERCVSWAKQLFASYNQSQHNGGQFAD